MSVNANVVQNMLRLILADLYSHKTDKAIGNAYRFLEAVTAASTAS